MSDITISSGVTSSGLSVSSGSTLTVLSGGRAKTTTVRSGGTEVVEAGGAAIGAQVLGGGVEILWRGARAKDIVVSSGGTLELAGVVVASGATSSAGIEETTRSVAGATLQSGAKRQLLSGRVVFGGEALVGSGGVASATRLSSGGLEVVSAGGLSIATLVSNGGREIVSSGGVASDTVVKSGGLESILKSGGTAVDTVVQRGGVQTVDNFARTTGTIVLKGGTQIVGSNTGVAIATVVESGGVLNILKYGQTSQTIVSSGGTVIDNGYLVFSGTRELDGVISGKGFIDECRSGASSTLVMNDDGSAFSGTVFMSRTNVELAAADAAGTGKIEFSPYNPGPETLTIDAAAAPLAGSAFKNEILDFYYSGQVIDLLSIAFVKGATAVLSSSTLTLTDGADTYRFKLSGNLGSAYSARDDGHGGTEIKVTATGMIQAGASLAPPPGAAGPRITNGGSIIVAPLAHASSAGGRA